MRPHVVLGLGGYISFPGGLMGVLLGKPLVLHEQNAVAGLANRVLASVAERQFSTFPSVFPRGTCIGNPLRSAFVQQAPPEQRFATRSGPLRILVVGGSLGAQALNENLPRALALIPPDQRPQVRHQSGERQLDALLALYQSLGVLADLTPFIDNPAEALAEADLIICRAGASTVSEVAAVGAAAIFVPYPHAVDDHQTRNARHLVDAGAGWLLPQSQLTPETLAARIQGMERASLLQTALAAHQLAKLGATEAIVAACEELAL